ncbi:MAG: hypothetical protein LKI32_10770 [Lachnospiraceae bacterium]|jgi:uncharacterized membrane protein HdeD (DUF308 family)|nr:hypothetical protein [Lachnospiraceae bacterium]MCI1658008.1 hypothetical protein [Lachnospiraceae bacterium]MCI2196374.1 hypothetical protein [Lachnospiraceae bacterium]
MKPENFGIVSGALALVLAAGMTVMSILFLHTAVLTVIGVVLAVMGIALIVMTVKNNRRNRRS